MKNFKRTFVILSLLALTLPAAAADRNTQAPFNVIFASQTPVQSDIQDEESRRTSKLPAQRSRATKSKRLSDYHKPSYLGSELAAAAATDYVANHWLYGALHSPDVNAAWNIHFLDYASTQNKSVREVAEEWDRLLLQQTANQNLNAFERTYAWANTALLWIFSDTQDFVSKAGKIDPAAIETAKAAIPQFAELREQVTQNHMRIRDKAFNKGGFFNYIGVLGQELLAMGPFLLDPIVLLIILLITLPISLWRKFPISKI